MLTDDELDALSCEFTEDGAMSEVFAQAREASRLRAELERAHNVLRLLVEIDPFDHDAPTGQSAGLQAALREARAALAARSK